MANRPDTIAIPETLVRSLLGSQHPDLVDLELRPLDRGWDNTNWRLGDELVVRIPHREVAADLIRHEQRWLPVLAPLLPLPIPAPVRCGEPSAEFAWPWSIVPWFDGVQAAATTLTDERVDAERLGQFFAALHVAAPIDAPLNPYRGRPLTDPEPAFRTRLEIARADTTLDVDVDRLANQFDEALRTPADTERVWLHGDLHARNVIVDSGRISAIIDWGDICSGDRATDLAAAFMLTPNSIDLVAAASGATDTAWLRARGWATHFAIMYLVNSDDDPVMRAIGQRLAARLLA